MNVESFPLDFEKDYPIAQEWANAWWSDSDGDNSNQLEKEVLPLDGVITFIDDTPAVVSFQYFASNAKISLMAYVISNPEIRGKKLLSAIDHNIEKSKQISREKGNQIQIALTQHKAVKKRLAKKGYYDSGEFTFLYSQCDSNTNNQILALTENVEK